MSTKNKDCIIIKKHEGPITINYNMPSPGKESLPSSDSVFPPAKNYRVTISWLRREREQGRDYFVDCGRNWLELGRQLSELFPWVVDGHSLYCANRELPAEEALVDLS